VLKPHVEAGPGDQDRCEENETPHYCVEALDLLVGLIVPAEEVSTSPEGSCLKDVKSDPNTNCQRRDGGAQKEGVKMAGHSPSALTLDIKLSAAGLERIEKSSP